VRVVLAVPGQCVLRGGAETDMAERKYSRVAVLMGGPSEEREISLKSGRAVARGLRQVGYEVEEVEIAGCDVALPPDVEAVFIALHGEFGEDGRVQALLDDMGVPYTGAGADASRLAMDKELSKAVFVKEGIPTAEYEVLQAGERRSLELPVVVKPVCQGSSIGVHCVRNESEWEVSFAEALRHGDRLLVERFVQGTELTAGVVGEQALPVIEIAARNGWYGYEEKYTRGMTEYIVPARLDNDVAAEVQELALRVFSALGCRGMGRVDFILTEAGELMTLELNTIPGFTETSLLPKAAAAAGMDFAELCGRIMESAE